ncbi:Salicylate hydroxylase, putative [Penicillium digitatum PHI26]|uniref:Salicylate hydroxylase, putative n=2 Tax=Penicillium digitatum TaxID=36651 RepID=K9G2X6_PEND2|nr:Salicylate hydroxylase, putative [Penicillium digitatum Pd1]EKV07623.1 Salicylate hydroxylase, putative [Penicillium digitatum Pd1]EKV09223.1 Salicylate hydroxylase, putative [Penicillium digitatum PHI26]
MNTETKMDVNSPANGLRVLIVGAGIGGLAAAIALRQQGHEVELFERSQFANEVGAAIHLTPNANGLLKRIGFKASDEDLQFKLKIRDYTSDGKLVFTGSLTQFADTWQHEWLLIHRAHLHEGLKNKAKAPGKGKPAVLHTSSKVTGVDPKTATVILEDGTEVRGDVVIGADGVHSVTRGHVGGSDKQPFSSGKNAFRFMISRKEVLDDPETAHLVRDFGSVDMWHSSDSNVVIYPCVNNEMLNFVCIHPDNLTNIGVSGGWDQTVGKDTLLEIYKNYDSVVRKILAKADAQTLKIWPLLDMETLPTWVDHRLALIGDAAHPFLPYRASGGAMALEDGIALGVLLPGDLPKEQIPERLKLYETARHERVTRIQEYTRESGRSHLPVDKVMKILSEIYDYDEFDSATELLRQHQRTQNPKAYYRQPSVFGPMPGPRQDFWGRSRALASAKASFCTASIKIKTSRTLLKNLLPNSAYSFSGNGSVAYATFSQTTLDGLDWLAGGGYNHMGLYIHGIEYQQANGEITRGTYLPIMFEDLTDPILSGREELGFPKVFSTIDVNKRQESYHVTTSWRGAVWGRMTLTGLSEVEKTASTDVGSTDPGILVHRYMPSVGREGKGTPEAEYPVFVDYAQESQIVPTKITRVLNASQGTIQIDGLEWNQLPTLHHIISRLAEIPVYGIVEAKVIEGEGVMDISAAKRIV